MEAGLVDQGSEEAAAGFSDLYVISYRVELSYIDSYSDRTGAVVKQTLSILPACARYRISQRGGQ